MRRRSTQAGYSSSFFEQNTGSPRHQALTTGSECLGEVRSRVSVPDTRHGRACPGYPRLTFPRVKKARKTWRPGVTQLAAPGESLHRCPKHPGREFGAAEVKTLALGGLAGSGLEHEIEDALATGLH